MENKIPTPEGKTQNAEALIDLVTRFLAEYHQKRHQHPAVTLDTTFDQDLGLDSLSRMELFSRVEQHFQIVLPERVYSETETPRDLLRALLSAGTRAGSPAATQTAAITETIPPGSAPTGANSLVDVLHHHATVNPDRPHIRLFSDQDEGDIITYKTLRDQASSVAAGLQRIGLEPAEPVAIMLPTGKDYFFSFFGVLLAGGIPVPIYPPARPSRLEEHLRRHTGILSNCRAVTLITLDEAKAAAQLLKSHVATLRNVVTLAELASSTSTLIRVPMSPQDTAFLQYTSGSTGNPKGVVLSHANLLANIRAMGARAEVDSNDVFVSWLPLYHDMGLIGAWLGSLHFAATLVVMPPLAFLARPERWLQAIHRFGGTLSASPNFGYELCLRRIPEKILKGLDLSSWRGAFNGAEAVSPATLEKFCERFGHCGFRRQAMMPVYGLAENSVGLAFPPLNRGPLVDRISRETYMLGNRAVPAPDNDSSALHFASCGHPLDGHQVRIVNEGNRELPDRSIGRLQFQGPSSTSGYYHNPEATRVLFQDGWLNSGDLAYIAEGEIYLTGRAKDLIIRAGRNIYPPELEEAIGQVEGIRPGCVVAFGDRNSDTGTERLVVLAETRRHAPERHEELRAQINAVTTDLIGEPPEEVVLAPPNAIPKTSSGKLRRAATHELYSQGTIGKPQKAVWLQVTRLALEGFGLELRKIRHLLLELLYGAFARTIFWLLAIPTWILVVVLPRSEQRWTVMRAASGLLKGATRIPTKVQGLENLPPQQRSCIFIVNHASYVDSLLLVASLPRKVSFVAKSELRTNPLARLFLERIEAEFVERFDLQKGSEDFRRIEEKARIGQTFLFFPEGTFTRIPGLRPFRMGAFRAAAEAGMPVVPVAIRGSRSILRGSSWLPHRNAVTITVGKTIEPQRSDGSNNSWQTAVRLRDAAREEILRYCGEPDLHS
ncbi:MAG: AMP-binding protein [Deltaproteobacteria bacterium]|nr:AMP-binding protein [Deltaproteobacteria bacterium]